MDDEQPTELESLLNKIDIGTDDCFTSIDDAIALLSYMVKHDTSSSHDPKLCKSNVRFVKTLEKELNRLGFKTEYMTSSYPPGSKIRHATLVARIGPENTPGGVILSSHTDVIPVVGQKWKSKPFELTQDDGKLTARGAVDMKQALSAYMTIAHMYKNRQDELKKPFYLALSWGEEIGCRGVLDVIKLLKKIKVHDPEAIIVGEPTDEKLLYAHKGASNQVVTIKAHGGHSANPEYWIDAGDYDIPLRRFIKKTQRQFIKETEFHDERYDPPYPVINAGKVTVGTSSNTVPGEATVELHLRTTPKIPLEKLLEILNGQIKNLDRKIKKEAREWAKKTGHKAPDIEVSMKELSNTAALEPQTGKPMIDTMCDIMTDMGLKDCKPQVAGFAADAGGLSKEFPTAATVIFGTGNLNQHSHQPNEYITEEQLRRAPMFALNVINKICRDGERTKPDVTVMPTAEPLHRETTLQARSA